MDESKWKRRTYFIKKEFQTKIIVHFVTLVILGSLVSGVLLYYFAVSESGLKFFKSQTDINLLPSIVLSQILVIILIAVATVYLVLFFSHKIAGPLHNIEKTTEKIGNGNLRLSMNLRKGDELEPLKIVIQQMIENLRIKISKFTTNYSEFKKIEDILHSAIQTSALSEHDKRTLKRALEKSIDQYEACLDEFALPDAS